MKGEASALFSQMIHNYRSSKMRLCGLWFSEDIAVKPRDYTLLINIDNFDKTVGEHVIQTTGL